MYISYESIIDKLEDIREGDIVYLISDILNVAKVARCNGERFDPNRFIDTLIRKVGETGTVLIPSFNWGFCKGKAFDYKATPSEAGALGNVALQRPDFIRTRHPIYSFCVYGKDKEKLFQIDPVNAFGEGTVFEYIVKNQAKALVIDLPTMDRNVICHHMEKLAEVPFRFEKNFIADYIGPEGIKSRKSYSMFVRNYDFEAMERLAPMNCILEVLGISRTTMINGIPFRVCDEAGAAKILYQDMKYNNSLCSYTYKGQNRSFEYHELYDWNCDKLIG